MAAKTAQQTAAEVPAAAGKREIAVVNMSEFALAAMDREEMREVITENLGGGGGIGAFDLTRIKVPTAGGTYWAMPEAVDGTERPPAKAIEGVILHTSMERSYWKNKMGSGDSPAPDCTSSDCVTGVGNPGGSCATCKFAQFGTATGDDGKPGRGQACKQSVFVFMLCPESIMPVLLILPPTSIKPLKQYRIRLTGASMAISRVLTSLSLSKESNKGGTAYSRVDFAIAGKLTAEDAAMVNGYRAAMGPLFNAVKARPEDYGDGGARNKPAGDDDLGGGALDPADIETEE